MSDDRAVRWLGSELVRDTIVGCYRLTGRWPETARLLFRDAMPAALKLEGERARAQYLRDVDAWWNEDAPRRARGVA